MPQTNDAGVYDRNLLRILTEVYRWESFNRHELQTVSGRDLYFKIASGLLSNSVDKHQPLKLLSGHVTDRTSRLRIREFQRLGLVNVLSNEYDSRTKRVEPTEIFLLRLNHHLWHFKQLCQLNYFMLDR